MPIFLTSCTILRHKKNDEKITGKYICTHISEDFNFSLPRTVPRLLKISFKISVIFFLAEINGLPEEEAKTLEGTLDTAFLFAYAISMLFFT